MNQGLQEDSDQQIIAKQNFKSVENSISILDQKIQLVKAVSERIHDQSGFIFKLLMLAD